MAPHTITHCINDDTSFLRESRHSRDIKYRILMNIKFYASQGVCQTVITFTKKHWILSFHSGTKRYQQNV